MSTDTARPNRLPRSPDSLRASLACVTAALLAAVVVGLGMVLFLSRNLPEQTAETLTVPADGLRFVFGSGAVNEDLVQIDEFADGYALLSGGQVKFPAEAFRVLRYTWLPPDSGQEAAFFWRRADDPGNVSRTDIILPGTQIIDLAAEPAWSGEILEIGFLIAGENSKPVAIGKTELLPDSLDARLRLAWAAWSGFEGWSQQSINFLYGGDSRQVVSLPLLAAAWFCLTLAFIGLLRWMGVNTGARRMLLVAGGLLLVAWMLLDVRWAANNVRQIRLSLENRWNADQQQRLSLALDGEIFHYVQRLKTSVLGKQNARILIVGDDGAADYYLSRAKYHLLPHSANVARQFAKGLAPKSVDYVIFFGQPENMTRVPGWNRAWQRSLVKVDSGEWGEVFRVRK